MPVVDSDCIIQFLRGNKRAVDFLSSAFEGKKKLKTTAFTVSELYQGAYASSRSAKNVRDVKDILQYFDILDFDEAAAIVHAQIAADLDKRGRPIGSVDPFIASIVIVAGETIVTRNVNPFKEIERLPIVNWEDAAARKDAPDP
jgi:tRNA(fMet)-specific endonuclease VapC